MMSHVWHCLFSPVDTQYNCTALHFYYKNFNKFFSFFFFIINNNERKERRENSIIIIGPIHVVRLSAACHSIFVCASFASTLNELWQHGVGYGR